MQLSLHAPLPSFAGETPGFAPIYRSALDHAYSAESVARTPPLTDLAPPAALKLIHLHPTGIRSATVANQTSDGSIR